ncbi:MAG: hypothetical protein JXR95_06815 [Deltaproteobacteria bacterium]|nr:hypothetical protein [Deltaproteobacteria bacterium]
MHHELVFSSPRKLPFPSTLHGQIVVLDIAFCSVGLVPSYKEMTLPFINELGYRLSAWVDHHNHPNHVDFSHDSRFLLSTKEQHRACPEMITEEFVETHSPVDTIVCHMDLDGLYSAAKWILGGKTPYTEADSDAAAIDSRIGEPTVIGLTIDMALRASFRDDQLKYTIINYLTSRKSSQKKEFWKEIKSISDSFYPLYESSIRLSEKYVISGNLAWVNVDSKIKFDKTELLLRGQNLAKVSAIESSGNITVAAATNSGINLLEILDLGGGMPTRVTLPSSMRDKIREKIMEAKLQ